MLAVSRAIALGEPLPRALDRIAEAANSVIEGASAIAIVLVAAGDPGYRLAGSHGLTTNYLQTVAANPELMAHSASARAITTGEAVWLPNAEVDHVVEGWRELTRQERYRSLLALPLTTTDSTVGALCVYRRLAGAWSPEQLDLLRFFAEHAALAVQTAQLLAQREEQVAALERLVRTLQDQAHEHANRLHAVRGLLALGEAEEAGRFLAELQAAHDVVRSEITTRIRQPTLAGLLSAVSAIAAQRDIRLEVDPRTRLDALPPTLTDSQLVTILGNLLDNAFDAVAAMPDDRRVVHVLVLDDEAALRLEVRDLGCGLHGDVDALLERGASTKDGHVGAGLALVREAATAAMGELVVERHEQGTSFAVVIPVTEPARA
jgi:signal transduction histidine kinase